MKIGMVAGSLLCGTAFLTCCAARAETPKTEPSGSQGYLLRYKFHPGEMLRWTVVNRSRVRTSVSESTQTVETNDDLDHGLARA